VLPREREFHGKTGGVESLYLTIESGRYRFMIRPFIVASIRKTFCTRRHNKQSMSFMSEKNRLSRDGSSSDALWQRLIFC